MTCEDIIQRLLDEKKISVKEAFIMIKELARNALLAEKEKPVTITSPSNQDDKSENDFWRMPPVTVCYGVTIPNQVTTLGTGTVVSDSINTISVSTDPTITETWCDKKDNK